MVSPGDPMPGLAVSASMAVGRKRPRTSSSSEVDRLSALPDVLLHTILSSLKARQVVQTSVLSKRWKLVWRSVPCLDIDQREFISAGQNTAMSPSQRDKFEDFADNVLVRRSSSFLGTFQLHIRDRHLEPFAGRWIRRALKCSPRELHLHFRETNTPTYILEMHKFGSSSRCLTKLHLSNVTLRGSFVEHISSVCTLLEVLELKTCNLFFREITHPRLKRLALYGCPMSDDGFILSLIGRPHEKLIIEAPCLLYLHLSLPIGAREISLKEMPSLVSASIHLSGNSYWCDFLDSKFLTKLFNVTSLELSGFQGNVMQDLNWADSVTFKNMRTLLLDECNLCLNVKILRTFLQNSPNLEKLAVHRCKSLYGFTGGITLSQCENLVDFKCEKLNSTEILYKDRADIGGLVRFLLDNSEHLPKSVMTIRKV